MAYFFTEKGAGFKCGIRMCTVLLWHLASKGHSPEEINRLVKDLFDVIRKGGSFTVAIVNMEMEVLGWPPSVIDGVTLELVVELLDSELGFSVASHTVN